MIEQIKNEFQNWGESAIAASPQILIGLVFLIFFTLLGSLIKRLFLNRFSKRFSDQLLAKFLGNLLFWVFVVIGVGLFLNQIGLGKAAAGLLAGAGVMAFILGFAFKDIGENLLAGVMLAFSRPFDIGDTVEVNGFTGNVSALNLRNTQLRTFNGRDIFIPNADMIKNVIINFTKDGLLRHDFIVGIDYSESIGKVSSLIDNCLKENQDIVHKEPLQPFIAIQDFGSSTLNLKVHFWINSLDFVGSTVQLKSRVMQEVMEALSQANINMPADIREHKLYQEEKAIPVELKQKS
ncbi:MAG: mechanosensitive ion channel [Vicingaceae bacterium]